VVLEERNQREYLLLAGSVFLSVAAHLTLATGVSRIEVVEPPTEEWVEMIVQVEEPPEPEPEVVEMEETAPEPVPPEPQRRPVRRMVQGLSSDSFAEGAGTQLGARAGTTTATRATDETMAIDEASEFATVPFKAVAQSPRCRRPTLTIPDELVDLEIQGRVSATMMVRADGSVRDVTLTQRLHPVADAACLADLRKMSCRPGTKDGKPVHVAGFTYSCRYEMAVD
jgi:outer membrane biosynthesis protein TonB